MTGQQYGELNLSFGLEWTKIADLAGGAKVWMPRAKLNATPGLDERAVGQAIGTSADGDPHGTRGGLTVQMATSNNGLMKYAERYEMLGLTGNGEGPAIWRPIPPPGYVALSDYIGPDPSVAGRERPWCVREDMVRRAEIGECRFTTASGFTLWSIVPPPYPHGDITEHIYIPGTQFTAVQTTGTPGPTPVTYVLDLPAAVEVVEGLEIPTLTSFQRPPAQEMITDRIVTVPYQMISDDARDESWKVTNSPFYTIERKRHYELVLYRDNRNGSTQVPESESVTTGISKNKEEAFTKTTGITTTETTGVEVSVGAFGMGGSVSSEYSVSQSIETGYEQRYGVTEMREVTKQRGILVPAKAAGCLWMERHDLLPVRADGDMLSSEAVLNFSTNYYVTGQWPADAEVEYFEDGDVAAAHAPASLSEQRQANHPTTA